MKKIVLLFILLSFAFSVQAADTKIAYIDLNRALNESIEGKKAKVELQDMVKSSEAVIEEKRLEIQKLEQEIIKQASILTPETIKEKQGQLETSKRDFQKMFKDSQAEVEKKQSDFMVSIVTDISKIVAEIGKEEGYTMIFEKMRGSIIYAEDGLDITDRVIKRFDEASQKAGKE